MKRKFSYFIFALLAMTTMTFVACDNDDDNKNDEREELNEQKNYASLVAKVSEEIFEYGDLIITMEHDGKSDSYHVSQGTHVDSLDLDLLAFFDESLTLAGRVFSLPSVECTNKPVKFTVKYELSEDGKQKIANATDENIFEYIVYQLEYGRCNAEGKLFDGRTNRNQDVIQEIELANLYDRLEDSFKDLVIEVK